jgi:hypothetical protein
MTLPKSIKDREYQKFLDDGSGNTAIRAVVIGGGGASPLTTKGDVYTYSTADARLPVGTNGQVLSADSAETTGLKWISAPPAAAGGSTTEMQWNNAGALDGTSGFLTDGVSPILTNGTFLIGLDSSSNNTNLIGVSGGGDLVIGDATLGLNTLIQSSNASSYTTNLELNIDGTRLKHARATDNVEQYFNINAVSALFTYRYGTEGGLANGLTHEYLVTADLVANNDIFHTFNYKGNNDNLDVIPYAQAVITGVVTTTGTESGTYDLYTMQGGAMVKSLSLGGNVELKAVDATSGEENLVSVRPNRISFSNGLGSDTLAWDLAYTGSDFILANSSGASFTEYKTPNSYSATLIDASAKSLAFGFDTSKFTFTRVDGDVTGPIANLFYNSPSPAVNDTVAALQFSGNDSVGSETIYGQILTVATNVTNTTEKAQLQFHTTVNGVSTLAGYFESAQFVALAGSVSAPGITFVGAGANTGIYSTGSNSIDVTLGGTRRWQFNASSLRGLAGSVSNPSITTIADPDTGLYVGTGTIGTTVDGTGITTVGSTGLTIADAKNIILNTTTGTKLGTGTTQKLGFWNATPIVQPVHIADPSGGAVQDTEARTAIAAINAMLAASGLTAAS